MGILAGTATAGLLAGAALGLSFADPNWLAAFAPETELPSPGDWVRREPFLLKRIVFRGLDSLEGRALVELAELRPDVPLVDLDATAVERRLEAHPRVASALALRLPPNRLIVRVEERVPVAALEQNGEGIDRTGARFALEPGEAEGLVAIKGEPPPRDLIAWALPALEAARQADFELVSATVLGPGDLVLEPRGSKLRLRIGEDSARALREFGALLENGILEDVPARAADLRFPGQVVLQEIETH
ncbi:MAG: FtsQ-type POTRA domain-containing protein [Myxococcales bacterium]|nr:FtsQ-type POTRA domain-containing protein [Myxococcales bacterium]